MNSGVQTSRGAITTISSLIKVALRWSHFSLLEDLRSLEGYPRHTNNSHVVETTLDHLTWLCLQLNVSVQCSSHVGTSDKLLC